MSTQNYAYSTKCTHEDWMKIDTTLDLFYRRRELQVIDAYEILSIWGGRQEAEFTLNLPPIWRFICGECTPKIYQRLIPDGDTEVKWVQVCDIPYDVGLQLLYQVSRVRQHANYIHVEVTKFPPYRNS